MSTPITTIRPTSTDRRSTATGTAPATICAGRGFDRSARRSVRAGCARHVAPGRCRGSDNPECSHRRLAGCAVRRRRGSGAPTRGSRAKFGSTVPPGLTDSPLRAPPPPTPPDPGRPPAGRVFVRTSRIVVMPSRAPLRAGLAACALSLTPWSAAHAQRAQDVVDLIVREGPRAVAIRAETEVVSREQAARRASPNPAVASTARERAFHRVLPGGAIAAAVRDPRCLVASRRRGRPVR